MHSSRNFERWFADYLGQDQFQVELLLRSRVATRFLIAWSLFESRCFNGFVRIHGLEDFAKRAVENENFERASFEDLGLHFHGRYQDKTHLRHLLQGQKVDALQSILAKAFDALSDRELLFMILVVVYRYRNNIIHGNKQVPTWLSYGKQIGFCIEAMQLLISLESATYNNSMQATAAGGA